MTVKDAYLQRFQLIWLPPIGFNDTFAMAVRSEDARTLAEPTLSAAAAKSWRLGIGYEFLTRADGLQRLNRTYGIQWDGIPKSMDLGLLYVALRQKGIDMGAGNSTDAQLSDPRFTVLRDDRKVFPPYNACYVVRRELIQQKPQVEWALSMLQNRISDESMRNLNRQVDIEHQPVPKVVRSFLATQP
jgi:osmoprotectant transport system substrate-binding protein